MRTAHYYTIKTVIKIVSGLKREYLALMACSRGYAS